MELRLSVSRCNLLPWLALLLCFVVVSSSSQPSINEDQVYDIQNSADLFLDDNHHYDPRILQSSNPQVRGEAYECDELFQPVVDSQPRPKGYEIRICVWPDRRTRARDVVMRSIDEFTFYKDDGNVAQPVVTKPGFQEATAPLSLVVCVPQQLICSLKTRLKDDFFFANSPGNITGTGQISFEFDIEAFEDDDNNRRRQLPIDTEISSSETNRKKVKKRVVVQQKFELRGGGLVGGRNSYEEPFGDIDGDADNLENRNHRQRQLIDFVPGGFAGTHDVSVIIPVVGVERPDGDPLKSSNGEEGWWNTAPGWLKALVIIGSLITLILLCCLCGLCIWSLRTRIHEEQIADEERKRREQEDEEEDDDDGDGVNVQYMPYNQYSDNPQQEMAPPDDDDDDLDQPTDYDICFDADDHPGTQDLHQIMIGIQQNNPDCTYGPTIYRIIKKQLPDRKYYVVDDPNHPDIWREAANKELIDLFRKEWDDLLLQQ